jgi:hypothetical protein
MELGNQSPDRHFGVAGDAVPYSVLKDQLAGALHRDDRYIPIGKYHTVRRETCDGGGRRCWLNRVNINKISMIKDV